MTGLRAFCLGAVTAATVFVIVGDGLLFTLVFWVPSLLFIAAAVGLGKGFAELDDGWRDLERRHG